MTFCIRKFVPIFQLNILTIGCSAVGKSSFINTLLTDEEDKNFSLCKEAKVRTRKSINEHCTLEYTGYECNEKNVRIFDTWGFQPNMNFKMGEFEKMLEGRYKEGNLEGSIEEEERDNDRIIDLVIFVLDGQKGVDEGVLKAFQPFHEKAMEKGKGIIFVVTKVDLLIEDILLKENVNHALNVCNNGKSFVGEKEKVLDYFENADIFPMINYMYHSNMPVELIRRLKGLLVSKIKNIDELRSKELKDSQMNMKKMDLFKNEKCFDIRYRKNPPLMCKLEPTKPLKIEDTSKYVFSDIHYGCLKLATSLFRFFVCRSLICSESELIGLYDPIFHTYFETTIKMNDNFRYLLNESFSEGFVPDYLFITLEGKCHAILNPKSTEFVILRVKGSELKLEKREYERFHCEIENKVQWKKDILGGEEMLIEMKMKEVLQPLEEEFKLKNIKLKEKEEEIEERQNEKEEEIDEKLKETEEKIKKLEGEMKNKAKEDKKRILELEGLVGKQNEVLNKIIKRVAERQEYAEFYPEGGRKIF